jgi:hypothetical protein
MFKKARKVLRLSPEKIISAIGASGQSAIYYLEKSYLENKLFNYLVLLRSEGVDMNEFIDEIINLDYPQYVDAINQIEKKANNFSQNEVMEKILKIIEPLEENINKKVGNRINDLEDFQKGVILKFKIELDIENAEEEIRLEEKKNTLKK